jgi:hypothetical protein
MNTEPDNKLSLEWVKGEHGVALVFDKKTWKVFEDRARTLDKTAEQIITTAVIGVLGTIMMDNYVLNRFMSR